MSDTRTMHTEIEVCGMVCQVEVTFEVTSFGTPDTYDEPGDGPEFYVESVIDTDTGHDWTNYCRNTRPVVRIVPYAKVYEPDPMMCAVIGLPIEYFAKPEKRFYHYRTELKVSGDTVLDIIEAEIAGDPDSFVYDEPDFGDW
jgi:hypothetical protein